MQSLRRLQVCLGLPIDSVCTWRSEEAVMLKPVAGMRRLEIFDVFMPIDGKCLSEGAQYGHAHIRGAEEIKNCGFKT